MIRPAITPRRITGNATTGLVSAARSGVRNVQRSTNTISQAPGVTKEQRFGMNYVEFFGSKKTYKTLQKSMKTIRDSMVSTFAIAKELKESVTEGKGVLGFVGKIIGIAAITIPFLPFLIPLVKVLAIAGIGGLLFAFKDQIFDFFEKSADKIFNIIKSKAKGFKTFVQDSIKEFFISTFKSGQFQETRKESVERLDESLSNVKNIQDIEKATQAEIKYLEQQKKIYQQLNPDKKNTKVYKNTSKAYDDRITEIKTGKIPKEKNILQKSLNFVGIKTPSLFESQTTTRGNYPKNYLTLSKGEKDKVIKKILGVTGPDNKLNPIVDDDGNLNENITKNIQTYTRDLERGDLKESEAEFAKNALKFLEAVVDNLNVVKTMNTGEIPFGDYKDSLKPATIKSKVKSENKVQDFNDRRKFRRGSNSGGGGNNVSVLPMGGNNDTQTLARNDIGSGDAAPDMQIWSNVDYDNFVALINKSSLNVV